MTTTPAAEHMRREEQHGHQRDEFINRATALIAGMPFNGRDRAANYRALALLCEPLAVWDEETG